MYTTLADWFMPLNEAGVRVPDKSRWCQNHDGVLQKTCIISTGKDMTGNDTTKIITQLVHQPYDVDEFPPDGIPDTPHLKLLSLSVEGAIEIFYGKDGDKLDEVEELVKEWILDNCRLLKLGPKRNVLGYIIMWNDKHADFEEVCQMITELKL